MHDAVDARLAAGYVLLTVDDPEVRRHLRQLLTCEEDRWPVLETSSSRDVVARLVERPARPHLAGVLLDWSLRGETAAQVLPWLDFAYPRTPVAVYTSGTSCETPARFCAERRIVHLHGGSLATPDLHRLARKVFRPWDEYVRRRRAFLLRWAGLRHADLTEHLLRLLDAYLESVSRTSLQRVRNLGSESLRKYQAQIRDILGVDDIDDIRSRWERESLGRFMPASSGSCQ